MMGPDGIDLSRHLPRPRTGEPQPPTRSGLDMARAVVRRCPHARLHRNRRPATKASHELTAVHLARRQSATWSLPGPAWAPRYHLAVVIDDAAPERHPCDPRRRPVRSDAIHVLLASACSSLPTPIYHHHRLIRDETGKRLAKRDDARAIAHYRARRCNARATSAQWSASDTPCSLCKNTRSRRLLAAHASAPSVQPRRHRAGRCRNTSAGWCDRPGPVWRTSTSRQSRSQSTRSSTSSCTWPEVSPLTQNACRERDQ